MSVAEQIGTAQAPVPTPCIGVCDINEVSGLCQGCARNADEVAAWQNAADDYKLRVWGELPARRIRAGLNAYRLPWSADDIAAMIERTLRRRWGSWVLGVPGASASFEIGANEDADIHSRDDGVEAITARGALRLMKHQKAVAIAIGEKADECGPEAIGLVLPRVRVKLERSAHFAHAGEDVGAICTAYRKADLFDLGATGELAARFCLRSADEALISRLGAGEGRSWQEVLDENDAAIDAARVHSVVETGLGRIEIFARPVSGMTSGSSADLGAGDGPLRDELPHGWVLPRPFAPCALFFPHSRRKADALLDGHF